MKNKFKNGLTLLFLLLTTLFYAQTKGISYQAVIYKPDTKIYPGVAPNASPLSNASICLQFTFLDSSNSIEYQETIKVTTDTFGIVKTTIGLGNQTGGYATSFASIAWNSNEKILITSLDLSSSCSAFEEISRQSFGSAPFAFSAVTAENISGVAAIANGGTGASNVAGAKVNLGLNNVDNTTDLNKPISIASQAALTAKEDAANKSTDGTLASNSNVKFPTEKAVKTYVDATLTAVGVADGSITATKLADEAVTSTKILNGTITAIDLADNSITNAKLGETITVTKGGTGTTNITGYIKGNGTSAFTSLSAIPIADVSGAIQKVNGNLPDNNGNVTLSFGAVFTGALANRAIVVATPNNGDIYVVSGDVTASNNGITFIYDGATWQEITSNQASLDARYLRLSGGTLSGTLTVPSGQNITIADAPTSSTDVVNKAYVDSQVVASTVVDANATTNGKIRLAGDLGGTAAAPTVPGLATKENTITTGTTTQYYRGDKSWQTLDKTAVGLANVDNTTDLNKPISTATQTALDTKEATANKSLNVVTDATSDVKFPSVKAVKTYVDSQVTASTVVDADASTKGKIQLTGDLGGTAAAPTVPGLATKENTIAAGTTTQYYRGDKSWQTLDKTAVGLANVDNTTDANKPISTATQTALDSKENTIAAGTTTQYYRGDKSWQTLDKTAVGLANVDNTTDLNKPISTATQTALDTKEATANKSLNVVTDAISDDKFPSVKAVKTYVDTQVTAATVAEASATVKGKIQLAGDLGGTATAPTVPGLANKENTILFGTTAQYYRGDKSWQTLDKTAVGLANIDNTTDANKPISTATQTALDTKEPTANKSTNVTTDAASDEKFPSVKAVKTYVDDAKTVSDIVTKTGDYTVVAANSTILCDASTAAFTLTLPDPATVTGRTLVINKIDESSNVLTITPALSLTTATTIGSVNYPTSFKVQSNGTNWYIIK